jgi:hypothetical protein
MSQQVNSMLPRVRCGFLPAFVVGILISGISGCSAEGEAEQATHFDHDHSVPDHWPHDLEDAASKLRQRVDRLQVADADQAVAGTRSEVIDLVSWAPEVAADTELSEREWMPIYEQSEAWLEAHRRGKWGKAAANQALELAAMLENAAASATIPKAR